MMFHHPKDIYFYGEFGCLNYAILGHIEEKQPKIRVCSQPDYLKLMRMKCPHIESGDDQNIYRANCVGAGFGLSICDKYLSNLKKTGWVGMNYYFGFEEDRCIRYIKPITSPLKYDLGLTEEYIGISFRNRTHESYRNLSDYNWKKIIDIIHELTDLPIIAHGMDIDTKKFPGIKKVESLEESIAYLNRSKVFIASMSGIAQFASNCDCGILQIGDPSRHINYDPFGKGAVAVRLKDFKSALLDFLK